ncbi:hypothetical protein M2284_002648 [Rhodococcus sp. LBL1]|nr:hypothetical protein [Rhodococcus sp. LBL1]MDH6684032.1 hypothetical protein [Rhodococcus sp. LBL2]
MWLLAERAARSVLSAKFVWIRESDFKALASDVCSDLGVADRVLTGDPLRFLAFSVDSEEFVDALRLQMLFPLVHRANVLPSNVIRVVRALVARMLHSLRQAG